MIRPLQPWRCIPEGTLRYGTSPVGVFCFRYAPQQDPANPLDGCRHGRLHALTLCDASPRLMDLTLEVDYASPKQIVFLDSRPLIGGPAPHAVNFVDTGSVPHLIPIFLNPETATEEVVAHEVGHAWLEHYLGVEDYREFADPGDLPSCFLVNCIQSYVLDCAVLWLLKRRGLPTKRFDLDIIESARKMISPLAEGKYHATDQAQVIAAGALAVPTAFPDLYNVDSEGRGTLDALWKACWRFAPGIARCATDMQEVLGSNGWQSMRGIVESIDGCLVSAFRYLGVRFAPSLHLRPKVPEIEWLDKFPGFLPGVVLDTKHKVLRDAIFHRRKILHAAAKDGAKAFAQFDHCGSLLGPGDLPEIRRPAPRQLMQYSQAPNPMFVRGSKAEALAIAGHMAREGQPGLQCCFDDGCDFYGNKFRSSQPERMSA